MEIEIKEKKENKVLKRLEVSCSVVHDSGRTPSRDEVKKLIAKELGKNEELISIEHIASRYGKNESSVYAKIYDDKESMSIEKRYLFNRGKKQEA